MLGLEDNPFDLETHNLDMFREDEVVRSYENTPIKPSEVILLLDFVSSFRGKSVLDLGVGTGRTTRYLLPFAARYVGVDYSPEMLASCRRQFPQAVLVSADVRDLSALGEEKFDFVFAPFNLLDAFSHTDRMAILSSMRDRLTTGGIFAFSAHNLLSKTRSQKPMLSRSRNPLRQIAMIRRYIVSVKNYRLLEPLEETHDGHARLRDVSHCWRGLVYFVDRYEQEAQLEAAGFNLLKIYDHRGLELTADDDGKSSIELYYICNKTD